MKIKCHCDSVIVDQTDYLSNKAHFIPDQHWFETSDALDDDVIDAIVEGRLTKESAYQNSRWIMNRFARLMWQCKKCGRLYVDDSDGRLRCFMPEADQGSAQVLAGRRREG